MAGTNERRRQLGERVGPARSRRPARPSHAGEGQVPPSRAAEGGIPSELPWSGPSMVWIFLTAPVGWFVAFAALFALLAVAFAAKGLWDFAAVLAVWVGVLFVLRSRCARRSRR